MTVDVNASTALLPGTCATGGAADPAAGARELVAGLLARPWGQVSPSVYETGRVVSLAPWLAGHAERVAFLVTAQRADGGWGRPEGGYALVPTLSATEALLAELRRPSPCADPVVLAGAVRRGLEAARRWSGPDGPPLPDMPAIELIVPSLVSLIDGHLAQGRPDGVDPQGAVPDRAGTEGGPGLPAGMDGSRLSAVRAWLEAGGRVPRKLVHALEVAGPAAAAAEIVPTPVGPGVASVGASPAAGAAWLGAVRAADDPGRLRAAAGVRRYLEAVVAGSGGPVPCAIPVTVFERGWTLSWLRRAGVPVDVPAELAASLREGLGPEGVAAGPGLPQDADTTSVALYALTLLGEPREPDGLWPYELETHFCTWQGEEGFSPTTNAHVLDAFGAYLRATARTSVTGGATSSEVSEVSETPFTATALPAPAGRPAARYAAAVRKVSARLRGCQSEEGSWLDRWHASPYYATACCALALHEFGGAESARAVDRAVRWVLAGQHADGSWGRWEGTAEETAYALQTLLLTLPEGGDAPAETAEAVARGHRFLSDAADGEEGPRLWHDKDLYFPAAIVRAAVLGALHLADGFLASGRTSARRP
ncbi:terpene cyclase/mutase family protein [Planomonospora sp. ID91781]|uniref:terpene cyclase/mutase family protein n=1 Tax=Planomonospora sp. ID91781 TaxID=2738135 RepID=UPI001E46813C|nr:terpene cyclase/mutase family protein [Planomonospora sp. ID91781]